MELMWSWAGLGCIRLPLSKLSPDLYYILYVSLNGTTPRAFLGPNERFLYLCPRCHIQEHFLFVFPSLWSSPVSLSLPSGLRSSHSHLKQLNTNLGMNSEISFVSAPTRSYHKEFDLRLASQLVESPRQLKQLEMLKTKEKPGFELEQEKKWKSQTLRRKGSDRLFDMPRSAESASSSLSDSHSS